MNATELAVIADVHGNAWALEAVLADIGRRGVKTIVNLGDNANGPLDPARECARDPAPATSGLVCRETSGNILAVA